MKNQLFFSTLLLIFSPIAAAQVYSCGPGCYTSSPRHGNGKAELGNKIGSYTSVTPRRIMSEGDNISQETTQKTARRANNAPARNMPVSNIAPSVTVPKLNAVRSSSRRSILEQELNNERNALADAQRALAEGRAVNGQSDAGHQQRIRSLESAVLDRQQNIQALQRELGRM